MAKYRCTNWKTCSWEECGDWSEHEHDTYCDTKCHYNNANAVCEPVPDEVICKLADVCNHVCAGGYNHKLPHKENRLCQASCYMSSKGRAVCIPVPKETPAPEGPYFYCVEGGGGITCRLDYQTFKAEVEERARQNPGKKVYILTAKEYCIAEEKPVTWHTIGKEG